MVSYKSVNTLFYALTGDKMKAEFTAMDMVYIKAFYPLNREDYFAIIRNKTLTLISSPV